MAPAEPNIPLNSSYISDYTTKPSLRRLRGDFGQHPPDQFESLKHSGKCHVESFNFMLTDGLQMAIQDLDPVEFLIPETDSRVSIWISGEFLSEVVRFTDNSPVQT